MRKHKSILLIVVILFMLIIPYQLFAQGSVYLPLIMTGPTSEQNSNANNSQSINSFKLHLDDIARVSASSASPTLDNGFSGFDSSVLGASAHAFEQWLTFESDRCLSNPFNESADELATSCAALERTLRGELTEFERWTIEEHGGVLLSGGVLSIASDADSEVFSASTTGVRHPSTDELLNIWISSGWWTPFLAHYTVAGHHFGDLSYAKIDMHIKNRNPVYDEVHTVRNDDSIGIGKRVGWFTGGSVNINVEYIAHDGISGHNSDRLNY